MRSTLRIFALLATTGIFFITECTGRTLNNVTDWELRRFTEELFRNENPVFQLHVRANLQGREMRRPYSDLAPLPMLTVDRLALETSSLKRVSDLFDNYVMDTRQEEIVTADEHDEQENILDDFLENNQIYQTMLFLSDRGFLGSGNQTYKDTLRDLWFSQFARQKRSRVRGSSAFEHIFLGEMRSGQKLIGLHNWVFFDAAERDGRLNYWGHRATKTFGNSTAGILSIVFFYSGKMKSSTIFIGTSPELEISLYTLCYFTRPNKYCRISMDGTKFGIQTYTINQSGNKRWLGTAYPVV